MTWRIFVQYYRPEISENSFFGMLDEKILLDYNIYFFIASELREFEARMHAPPLSFEQAKTGFKYWKLSVYRSGETACFKMLGEQLV